MLLHYPIDIGSSNFDALTVSPMVATLPKEMQDLQENIKLIAKDTAPSPMRTVGDVPEIPRQVAGLVQMSPRNPQSGK